MVYCGPQHKFYERLGSHTKERHVLEGFYHDTFGEKDRKLAIDKARRFIVQCFENRAPRPNLLEADRSGFTRTEADELASPFAFTSWKRYCWRATRFSLKLMGYFSKGIGIGHKTGFDSGTTLDYVYQNKPGGFGPLGRMIDRNYLNSIGWKGIRQRRLHIEELLGDVMSRTRSEGKQVRIVDIAAGHGRYVLGAIAGQDSKPQSILLRDYCENNVAAGRNLITEKDLSEIASFVKADAFDGESIAAIEPRPNIGIVSGLYELFSDNNMIRTSLEGLSKAIPEGDYLIYTNQPWHPQIEMIARALTSHRQGQAWVMRRRSQAEMDQLVEEAGFIKIDQRVDEWGIFTVSVARRNPS